MDRSRCVRIYAPRHDTVADKTQVNRLSANSGEQGQVIEQFLHASYLAGVTYSVWM